MKTEIDAVKAEVAAVKAKVEGLEKKIEGVEEKIKETEAGRPWLSLTEQEQDHLSGLQREKTSLQGMISSLQETISSLQDKENILLSQLSTGINTLPFDILFKS